MCEIDGQVETHAQGLLIPIWLGLKVSSASYASPASTARVRVRGDGCDDNVERSYDKD